MTRTLAFVLALLAAPAAIAQTAEPAAPPPPPTADAPPATAPPATTAPASTAPATNAPAATAPPQPAPPPPAAQPAPQPAPQKEKRGVLYPWLTVGTTFAYGQTYGNVSAGLGYVMNHGLTPNLEVSYSWGATPTLWAVRPGVTWFLQIPVLHPYVGAYYTHWFVSGNFQDQNGVGARLGISLGRSISLGVTYDRVLNCSHQCDSWTPLIGAAASF